VAVLTGRDQRGTGPLRRHRVPARSGDRSFVDSGIASHLLGQDATRLGEPGGAAGPMLENFVAMEIARQLTWSDERSQLHHYRTKDNLEVDIVLETPDGRVVEVEVKAGATVRTEDLSGLRHLANHIGDRFVAGFVLYTGQQTLPFGSKIEHCRWTRCGALDPDRVLTAGNTRCSRAAPGKPLVRRSSAR
jgi:predicted AAA+ superfamily ATPase